VNLLLCQRAADERFAQRPYFNFAFNSVAGLRTRIYVAGVTAQFCETLTDFAPQHSQQTIHPNLLKVRLPTPLTVELREVTDVRMLAQR